ncbi:uncharacterized protein LOC125946362 [Dermacentor silvarum]|uniref:uncharacterized protein LOC125946362 n=1 Tax=Dermacentor silvarum TaxID=543639 RepID=UPI0021018CB0|nr:uncharacterized protein LOC125946362 [Dermacentor silvarum]
MLANADELYIKERRTASTQARRPGAGGTDLRRHFPNGSWAGCLGRISRNEADLALGPILPTISRFEVAQPLPQYYFIHLTLCGGTKRLYKTDVFAYVTALDSQTPAKGKGESVCDDGEARLLSA